MQLLAMLALVRASYWRKEGWLPPAPDRSSLREGSMPDVLEEAKDMMMAEFAHVPPDTLDVVQTKQLRAHALKPEDVTGGKMCKAGPDTTSMGTLLKNAKDAIDKLYNMENKSGWVHHGSDDNSEWSAEGGESAGGSFAHVYGEVEREGMFEILKTAACIVQPKKCSSPEELVTTFRTFHFYDLGSGQGKFPMFASLLGFEYAKGIELDQHRAEYASTELQEFGTAYPCLAKKLGFEHGSFIKPDAAWTKTQARRIVFLDAVCFTKMWPEISRMMKGGETTWGPGSVVVSLGRDFVQEESGLLQKETKMIPTSWAAKGSSVKFYVFAH